MRVAKDNIGRDDLRSMAVGQAVEFFFPDMKKFPSFFSTIYQMTVEGVKFSRKTNKKECSILVTRME